MSTRALNKCVPELYSWWRIPIRLLDITRHGACVNIANEWNIIVAVRVVWRRSMQWQVQDPHATRICIDSNWYFILYSPRS